jgi:hypothetical protein
MFLLSYSEVNDRNYGFTNSSTKKAQGSDYAKCQGLNVKNNNSYWWLRSPYSNYYAIDAYSADYNGSIYSSKVYCTNGGVRPACWIKL